MMYIHNITFLDLFNGLRFHRVEGRFYLVVDLFQRAKNCPPSVSNFWCVPQTGHWNIETLYQGLGNIFLVRSSSENDTCNTWTSCETTQKQTHSMYQTQQTQPQRQRSNTWGTVEENRVMVEGIPCVSRVDTLTRSECIIVIIYGWHQSFILIICWRCQCFGLHMGHVDREVRQTTTQSTPAIPPIHSVTQSGQVVLGSFRRDEWRTPNSSSTSTPLSWIYTILCH